MSKMKKIGIGIVLVVLLCIGCFVLGQKSVEIASLYVEDGMIKYKSNGSNEDVISLEELLTKNENSFEANGKEVEFSVQDGYIVWNYVGETKISKLISIEDLVGKQGEKGDTGSTGKDGTNGVDGKDGKSAYIWVKYLDNAPESSEDSDLKDEASSYMGIYYGENVTAPTDISSYKWYAVKGEKGEKGDKGDKGEQGEKGETGENGKDGVITDIAVIKGTVKKTNSPVVYITNDDGLFYSSSKNISIKKGAYSKLVLESGKYLVTLNGSITFTGDTKELPVYFNLDGNTLYSDIYEGSLSKTYFSTTQYVDTINSNGFFEIAMMLLYSYDNVNYTITIMKIG